MAPRQVAFYLPRETSLPRLRELDPDRDWRELVRGERAWILQTYLRLKFAGRPVELVDEVPTQGILVYHKKHERQILEARVNHLGGYRALTMIAVRGDRRASRWADFQVVQNPLQVDEPSRFLAPHWPQPGLLPRHPERGTRIERVAFKGFSANLDRAFLEPDWGEFLARRGVDWDFDAIAFREGVDAGDTHWNDYRETDLVLALRPGHDPTQDHKPATKLVNAWTAGVPALLGPEQAFRSLRQSELDYLEISDLAAAKAAVDRLLAAPDIYRAMVENGFRRSADFSPQVVTEFWLDLLWRRVPEALASRHTGALGAWHRARQVVRRGF